jgi:hypothetical protein
MKISVFRITYHTITSDKAGKEINRTSPEVTIVAAKNLDEAKKSLPANGVLIQSQTLNHDITFVGEIEKAPGAKRIEPPAKATGGPTRLGPKKGK